ncbi:folate-binding protein YgfZ [Elioraea sp.]|uniref:CAF17-like 4Fe-4S cluster assembly/insertion protein YgfZ n=1 Tax=Elioraea sp. TaxID=2185103 RepID=UPI0025B8F664|nr:folate-binding protein [Elioraea sp.]
MESIAHLPHRGAVAVEGPDRVTFLQGLVSADVREAAPGRAPWSALLTPQGKWVHEFFILADTGMNDSGRLVLECERERAPDLAQRLSRFRLRAKVTVADISPGIVVAAGWGMSVVPGGLAAPDPRLPEAGWRGVFPLADAPPATADWTAWDAHRLALGLPDGSRDLEADRTLLLEAWFELLGGVSWTKGCYMGQELTARTKYRGLVKRHLVPVAVSGPLPAPGTPVLRDGAEVGTVRSGRGALALAMLRTDAMGGPLTAGEATLTPAPLPWMAPEDASGEASAP